MGCLDRLSRRAEGRSFTVSMIPSDKDLRHTAARLVSALVGGQLFEPREGQEALERRVFAVLRGNFDQEAEIDREAKRVLEQIRDRTAGMDSRTLLAKIRQRLARDRGFVL
jgi:hypothetical protein